MVLVISLWLNCSAQSKISLWIWTQWFWNKILNLKSSVNWSLFQYLYSALLSSKLSDPHLPFISSITWFLRNFLNNWIVCCLVTSGPKLLLFLSTSWSQSIASDAVKQLPCLLKCCLCFLSGMPARKYFVISFHCVRNKQGKNARSKPETDHCKYQLKQYYINKHINQITTLILRNMDSYPK